MDPLILRPIITAIIEYALFGYVLKKGKFFPKVIAGILFFLASYQLGEVIFLLNDNTFGIQISYASTALLPAFGVLLIERISGKNYLFPVIFVTAMSYSLFFILTPSFIGDVETMHCFTKLIANIEDNSLIFWSWVIYYIGTLTTSTLILCFQFFTAKTKKAKSIYGWTTLAYLMFFPFSILLVLIFGIDIAYLASIMCGLAIFAAFIMAWMSLTMHESVRYRG